MSKKDFAIIPMYIMTNPNINSSTKLVYSLLFSLSNSGKGFSFATNKYLADQLNCSTRTIILAINELQLLGFIQVKYEDKSKRGRQIYCNIGKEYRERDEMVKRKKTIFGKKVVRSDEARFIDGFMERWNSIGGRRGFSKMLTFTGARRLRWLKLYKKFPENNFWEAFFRRLDSEEIEKVAKLLTDSGNRWFNSSYFTKDGNSIRFERFINGDLLWNFGDPKAEVGFTDNKDYMFDTKPTRLYVEENRVDSDDAELIYICLFDNMLPFYDEQGTSLLSINADHRTDKTRTKRTGSKELIPTDWCQILQDRADKWEKSVWL